MLGTHVSGPVGDFDRLELLGRGGMGMVWRARRRDTGEEVALKLPSAQVPGALEGLGREIRALAAIDHPGVVRMVADGVLDGEPWYAMELIEGDTLRSRVARTWQARFDTDQTLASGLGEPPRSPEVQPPAAPWASEHVQELLAPMIELCDALAHVHGAGLVHCDLTPSNVLVRRDGEPVLIDFGLVAPASQVPRHCATAGSPVPGTPLYMAPEQIRGEVVDARTDLYALGCILYEIATGMPPFVAPTVAGVLASHLVDEPSPPSQLAPAVPAWLDELVRGLLAKARCNRIGSAREVAAALARGLRPAPGLCLEGHPRRGLPVRPTLQGPC
jgi:serine/threonine protein kinase